MEARQRAGVPELDRPIFVVGPPRSGTTMLRVALSRHPDVHVATETHFLDQWLPRFPGMSQGDRGAFEDYWGAFTATPGFTYLGLPADAVPDRLATWGSWEARSVLAALLDATAVTHGVSRVGEKTPDHVQHLSTLLDWFPDARILYVLRDPRATVASELRFDAEWASDQVAVAARRWRRCVLPLERWAGHPRVHAVHYEDLVGDPDGAFRAVCDHVEVDFHRALLADEGGHDSYRHGDQDPWGPIDGAVVAAWRGQLDAAALADVETICGPLCALAGYPRPTADLPSGLRLRVHAHRALRRVGRRWGRGRG